MSGGYVSKLSLAETEKRRQWACEEVGDESQYAAYAHDHTKIGPVLGITREVQRHGDAEHVKHIEKLLHYSIMRIGDAQS